MSHSSSCNYQLAPSPFLCLLDNGHLEDQTPLFDLLLPNATHYDSSSNYSPTLPANMDPTYSLTPFGTSANLKGSLATYDHHQHLGAACNKDAQVAHKKKTICLIDKHKEKTQGRKKKMSNKVSDEHTSACQGDCVYVRARNGQATDSHSLAERLRRQKIRDKMKLLQSLVPGCDKIVGKTLILDEIINYIHSLQSQVEFLMEKLASVDPALCANYLSVDLLSTPKEESCGRISLDYSTMLYECDQDDQASLYRMCAASSPSALTSAWLASLNDQEYYTI